MSEIYSTISPMLLAYNNPITTAQRNAITGQLPSTVIFNSDVGHIEIWDGSAWVALSHGSDTLQEVLTAGNDGGGLDMINLNNVTVNQLNYTTLNPPVAATTPGGSDTQIQYNNGGSFGGSSVMTFDDTAAAEQVLVSGSSSTALMKIVQTGGGNCFEVHDAATDTSVFQIKNDGKLIVGSAPTSGTSLNVSFSGVTGSDYFRTKVDGTETTPVFSRVNDTDTGMFFPATDNTLAVTTAGTERFRFGDSGDLLVGGTAAGTSGQVLTSGGAGAAVSWTTPASGATEVGELTDCMTVTTDAQFVDSISLGNPYVGSAGAGLSSSSNTISISSTALSTNAALINLTNGVNNISIGNETGQGLTTGDNNVFMGYQAAKNAPTDCKNSTFIGSGCFEGGGSTTYSSHNTAVGMNAMHGTSSTGVTDNTAIGAYSMYQIIDGDYNTAVGKSSMLQLRSGYRNSGLGWEAGIGNQSGNDNVAVGYRAFDGSVVGNRNTALGTEALGGGFSSNIADNNIAIGYLSGKSMTGSCSRNVIIGGALNPIAGTTTDDQLRICNGDATVDWLEGVQTGEVYIGGSTAPTKVHCSTINVDDNTTAIGGASASISGATLTVDGGSSSYAYARVTVPATSTITTLTATNVRENGQLVILIEGSASGTLTIQGSDAGGITNAKVNFTSNVDVANNENALLTMFKGNGNIFISASKYL